MRRALSILLTLAFGFGPLAFAIGYDDGASLPACCRRHGAHHCAMGTDTRSGSSSEDTPALTAPSHCPLFPVHQNASPSSIAALIRWPLATSTDVQAAHCTPAKTFANGAGNLSTFPLRGPPTTFPSA
jgi:hypothetical protein